MSATQHNPIVLRTAAVWGTTVLAVRDLRAGQSLELGEQLDALVPKPDGIVVSSNPVRAVGAGWDRKADWPAHRACVPDTYRLHR